MLYEDANSQKVLRRMVSVICRNESIAEDLMQEGLIRLWILENRHPGQTRSWYFQGCQFHLRNMVSAGRSLDALKRSNQRLSHQTGTEEELLFENWELQTATMPEFGLEESVQLLTERLDPVGQSILRDLLAGFGPREIARKLRISHQAVTKRRKRIAALAGNLGIVTAPSNRDDQPLRNLPTQAPVP